MLVLALAGWRFFCRFGVLVAGVGCAGFRDAVGIGEGAAVAAAGGGVVCATVYWDAGLCASGGLVAEFSIAPDMFASCSTPFHSARQPPGKYAGCGIA